ncbi:PA14 domain-containing protein [Chitinophaga sp. 212800010-3]|uniref:PA14 domain-containing protein n=1 Tax=unclassified Chitinophaga TaxID=2619133 RepID=UPI002E126153
MLPANAQTVLNPNDPVVTYDSTHPPVTPVYTQITRWVRTVRMTYSTDSYKCYIYKNMAFRLKFPKTYAPGVNDGKKYPIYLFLHGVGEAGTIYDNEDQLLWGGQTWASRVDNGTFDGYLLYPQSQGGYWGPNDYDNLKEVVDSLVASCKGDPDRLVLNGLSAGGYGIWEFLFRYPQLTAAALPMSAMTYFYPDSINRYKFTPLWQFQGGLDGSPAPYTTNVAVSAMQAAGADIKLTTYPNDAHNTWLDAWNEPDFTPFMLRANRLNPTSLFGTTVFCPGDTITVGVAPGALQYEWQKDGTTIYTGTSNFIAATIAGSYRVRMQLPNGWTGWAPVPLVISYRGTTPVPVITTSPALASNVLPAPDGSTSITMQVPAGMASYQWQGVGAQSTTNTLTTSTPGGYYVSQMQANACSSATSDTFRVVSAAGANGPDTISGLTVTSVTQTQVTLSWTENPTPKYLEKYFEIYRATKTGGPYTLTGRNSANADTYTDNGLVPGTNYFYIVRPVNDNAAAPVSTEIKGTTAPDTIPPTAPVSLRVTGSGSGQVTLSWNAATDNVGVTGYDIYANNTLVLSVGNVLTGTVTGLNNTTSYNFYIKAKDAAGNTSAPSNQVAYTISLLNLNYKYYTGSWTALPNFSTLTPVQTGKTGVPDLSVVPAGTTTNYALMWTGYIRIPVTGSYTFTTNSDDGSKLYFNTPYSSSATPTVNNDGLHVAQSASGTVNNIAAGVYPITITYFQAGGGYNMQVYWTSTAAGITTQQLIPASAFVDPNTIPPADPSGLTVTTNSFSKLNLKWTRNSTNETGFEIYRSVSSAGTYSLVTTTGPVVVAYTDTALQANTTYYYQVRAIGSGGNSNYTPVASGTTAPQPNLNYKYYKGSWSALPNFSTLTPVQTGKTAVPDLSVVPAGTTTYYALMWTGYIRIPVTGSYTFTTNSDDGSKLYFNIPYSSSATPTVNNDGLHGARSASGTVNNIAAGVYPITITYFQASGGYNMQVYWTSAAAGINTMQLIPASAFVPQPIQPLTGTPVALAITDTTASSGSTPGSMNTKFQVNVYPNPFVNDLAIDLALPHQLPSLLIEIVNINGQSLYREIRRDLPEGKNLIRINTQGKINTPGIYFLRLTSPDSQISNSVKLMKQQ